MRKFSSFLVAACMLAAGSIYANNLPTKEPKTHLTNMISALLTDYVEYADEFESDLTAIVKFTLNEHREIVVLSVKTEDANLEDFVKNRLNYEKVEVENLIEGRKYVVPVRIEAIN